MSAPSPAPTGAPATIQSSQPAPTPVLATSRAQSRCKRFHLFMSTNYTRLSKATRVVQWLVMACLTCVVVPWTYKSYQIAAWTANLSFVQDCRDQIPSLSGRAKALCKAALQVDVLPPPNLDLPVDTIPAKSSASSRDKDEMWSSRSKERDDSIYTTADPVVSGGHLGRPLVYCADSLPKEECVTMTWSALFSLITEPVVAVTNHPDQMVRPTPSSLTSTSPYTGATIASGSRDKDEIWSSQGKTRDGPCYTKKSPVKYYFSRPVRVPCDTLHSMGGSRSSSLAATTSSIEETAVMITNSPGPAVALPSSSPTSTPLHTGAATLEIHAGALAGLVIGLLLPLSLCGMGFLGVRRVLKPSAGPKRGKMKVS